MKKLSLLLLLFNISVQAQEALTISTTESPKGINTADSNNSEKKMVAKMLDAWHNAAATAKFGDYFSHMAADGIFIGTDATENWNVEQFKAFAKPYFDKGSAWNFKAIQRNIYITKELAWFDELLDTTNMKICRGSGVLRFEKGQWKIVHYVLSMTIPNGIADEVTKMKSGSDDKFVKTLLEKK